MTTVRATVGEHTLNGTLDDAGEYVHVHVSHGPVLGAYKLDRFENSRLTSASLAALFTPKD